MIVERRDLGKTRYQSEILIFSILYLIICTFIIYHSPLVLLYVGHDITPVLDGVWRIENHQIPHKEFSSILGYGYLLQQRLFLKIFSYDFIAFTISSIAITTVVFIGFLFLYSSESFKKNTTFILRVYLFLVIIAIGLGQYNFGTPHTHVTYANLYNRYCFLGLLSLLVLLFLLRDKKIINYKTTICELCVGIILIYLLFVKITYFGVAFGLITLFLILSLISFKTYYRIVIISAALFAIFLLLTKADFFSIIKDYKIISDVRKGILIKENFFRSKLLHSFGVIFILSFVFLIAELFIKKVSLKFIFVLLFVGISAILLHFTNWGETDIVMLSFIPIVFMLLPQATKFFSFKVILVISSFFLYKNFKSIYYLSKAKDFPHTELKNKYLSGFYTDFAEYKCGEDYATRVMSGVDLVDKNKRTGDKVFTFSFDNPFPFLTHTIPPKHVPTVWQAGTTYSYDVYPNAKILFSDVELLMVPKCIKAESATEMMNFYGSVVANNFIRIDDNSYWTLYRKSRPL